MTKGMGNKGSSELSEIIMRSMTYLGQKVRRDGKVIPKNKEEYLRDKDEAIDYLTDVYRTQSALFLSERMVYQKEASDYLDMGQTALFYFLSRLTMCDSFSIIYRGGSDSKISLDARFDGETYSFAAKTSLFAAVGTVVEEIDKRSLCNTERVDYHEYIQSPEWKAKATDAKERAGWRCQVCNRHKDEITLHAHHRTYDRLGEELPEDITVLCADCHAKFHDKL